MPKISVGSRVRLFGGYRALVDEIWEDGSIIVTDVSYRGFHLYPAGYQKIERACISGVLSEAAYQRDEEKFYARRPTAWQRILKA